HRHAVIDGALRFTCGGGIHRHIGQVIGHLVLLAGDPRVGDPADVTGEVVGFDREGLHIRVFDLPPAGHLLDHELGVHEYLHLAGPEFTCHAQALDEAAVFRHVVGGAGAHHIGDLPEDLLLVLGVDHGAGSGDAG